MAVSKISLPADFGIENLDCPVHGNIEIKLQEDQKMRANSMILSLHSPVFQNMFFKLGRTSVDFKIFTADVVRQFFAGLYSGKVDIQKGNFREFHNLAAVFKIEWLQLRCHLAFMKIIKSFLVKNADRNEADTVSDEMEEMKWILDEAIFAKKVMKISKLFEVTCDVFVVKVIDRTPFIKYYLSDFAKVSTDQLDISIKIAGDNVKVLMEILKDSMVDVSISGLGKNSTYLLGNIDLGKCRELEPDLYKQIFNKLMQKKETLVSKTTELKTAHSG